MTNDTSLDLNEITDRLFAAAEANDWAAFHACFAPGGTIRQNVGTTQTIDEAMKTLPLLTADGTSLVYENVRRVVADRAVTELHDAVFTKPDGRVVRLDICVVIAFDDDGLVTSADEYLDSGQAAALFA